MSVPDVSGKAIANLEIESLKHAKPTFHGDTIYAQTTVLDKVESRSKPDRGVVVGGDDRHEPARRGGVRVPAQGARAQAARSNPQPERHRIATVRAVATAISVNGLTKRYGDHTAVDGVSFSIDVGETFGILGPNGAGKTTTLEMIEGLRKPDAGEVFVLDQPVWPDPRAIQARIGVQLQTTNLFEALSAPRAADPVCKLLRAPRTPGSWPTRRWPGWGSRPRPRARW